MRELKFTYDSDYQGCYVCGQENSMGMKLSFFHDDDRGEMFVRCSFEEYMQGYEKIVHGGFLSMLLDEVMAKACLQKNLTAVTAHFSVRFKKPVYVHEEITFFGKIAHIRGKTIKTEGRCIDSKGIERASAEALFIRR